MFHTNLTHILSTERDSISSIQIRIPRLILKPEEYLIPDVYRYQ